MAPRAIEVEGRVARSLRGASKKIAHVALAAAVVPIALALLALLLGSLLPSSVVGAVLVSWLIGWGAFPVLAAASALLGRRWSWGQASVRANASGLAITGESHAVFVERDRIAGAIIVSKADHEELEVTTVEGHVYLVRLPSELAGHQVLDVLGYGRAGRRVAVSLGSEHDALGAGCGGLAIGTLATTLTMCGASAVRVGLRPEHILGLVGAVFVVTTIAAARLFEGSRVVVGSDGVSIDRMFGSRFIPYSQIEAVHLSASGLMLVLAGERPTRVQLSGQRGARELALAERIQEAMAAAGADPIEPRGAAMLDRGGRPLPSWREALRTAATAGAGYRRADMTADALVEVATDADAPVERRIGAAMAVAATGDAAAASRLRIAAEGLASERLRVAMEKAVDGELEEEQIEEAVREAEARRVR